jgi:hypothetical protein
VINLLEDLQDRLDLIYLLIAHDLSVVRHRRRAQPTESTVGLPVSQPLLESQRICRTQQPPLAELTPATAWPATSR